MLSYFEIYGISISVLSIFFLIILIRLKGVFDWKYSISHRLKKLKQESLEVDSKDSEAKKYVYFECKKLYRKIYFGKPDIIDFHEYISNIAGIYYPDKEKPIYQISLGSLLYFTNLFSLRLDEILKRKGFSIISDLRVKNLYRGYDIYQIFLNNRFFKSIMEIWSNYSFFKLLLYLNPIGLLFFLSSNLVRMSIIKFIITDCYLFAGSYAIRAYSGEEKEEAFYSLKDDKEIILSSKKDVFKDRDIKKIRKELLFKSLFMGKIPTIEKWRESVEKSAEIISGKYFEDSSFPVREAKIGLILDRASHWVGFFSELRERRIIKYFFNIKLSSIQFTFDLKDKYLPEFLKKENKIIKNSLTLAGYTRTLYKIYKTPTPVGLASWAGGEYGKNILIFFLLKSAYDKMILEIDIVYKNSL